VRIPTKLLLAGAGSLAIAGAAIAAADRAHVMNIALPDGTVAQIHYVGDVAPKVVMAPETMPAAFLAADPFAMFDRVAWAMDRQMDAMLQQASLMASAAPVANGQLSEAALRNLPAGTVSYSYTSYSSDNGGSCSQSVQVTALGANQAPKVVRQNSGDCIAMNSRAVTPAVEQARPAAPALTRASLEKPKAPEAKGPVI
jgi:hypothetical protein